MGRDRVAISTTLAMIGLADAVLCWTSGLSFSHWSPALPSTMAIAIIGLGYHWSGRSARIADMAHWTVLWVAFSIVGAILTYLAARHGAAWSDNAFAALITGSASTGPLGSSLSDRITPSSSSSPPLIPA
jgi:hypothetical protein